MAKHHYTKDFNRPLIVVFQIGYHWLKHGKNATEFRNAFLGMQSKNIYKYNLKTDQKPNKNSEVKE